jgi:hypothetical protein
MQNQCGWMDVPGTLRNLPETLGPVLLERLSNCCPGTRRKKNRCEDLQPGKMTKTAAFVAGSVCSDSASSNFNYGISAEGRFDATGVRAPILPRRKQPTLRQLCGPTVYVPRRVAGALHSG